MGLTYPVTPTKTTNCQTGPGLACQGAGNIGRTDVRTQIVSIEDISASQIVQWNRWACPNGKLVSPYLRFEFAETVARARNDVRIAIIEDAGDTIGFFPHHKAHGGIVRPVGAPMSDYQGCSPPTRHPFLHRRSPGRLAAPRWCSTTGMDRWPTISVTMGRNAAATSPP